MGESQRHNGIRLYQVVKADEGLLSPLSKEKDIVKLKQRKSRKYLPLYLMTIPGFTYFLINNYLPMAGITIAFRDINYTKGVFFSDWVGLKNFEFLFRTDDVFLITRNTLLYNLAFIVLNTVVAVLAAVLLNEIRVKPLSRFYQTSILLPYLISMTIVAYLVYAWLSEDTGMLNNSLLPLFGGKPVSWYSEPRYWPFILPLVNTWKNFGYLAVIYYAAIVGFDRGYYEAAILDGASFWQQVRYITLPLLKPVISMMVLLSLGKIFYSDFGLFYQVTMDSGMLSNVTSVIDTYVYRGLMQLGNISMSAAAGVYQSLVGFVLVMVSNFVVKKLSPENSLF